MNILTNRLKTPVSILVMGSVLALFSLTSFAALEGDRSPAAKAEAAFPLLDAPTGTVTKVKRNAFINGAEAKEGATVLDGSLFRTQIGSRVIVDLPTLGFADYGESTESVLTLADKSISASLNRCGFIRLSLLAGVSGKVKILSMHDVGLFSERREVDVKVERGEVLVKRLNNKENILKAGDHEEYEDAIEVTAIGDAMFNVYCREDHYLGLFFLPAVGALLLPLEDSDVIEELPPLSPLQP